MGIYISESSKTIRKVFVDFYLGMLLPRKKELFKGLAIEQLEKEWKQYPVFHIDFNGKNFTQAGELEKPCRLLLKPKN